MTKQMKIGDWRTKIDAIDTTLLHLLNVRAGFALEVGRLKGSQGLALRVPQREQEILTRLKSLNPGPLDDRAIEAIYRTILGESIRIQADHGLGVVEMPATQTEQQRGDAARPAARSRKVVRA